MSTGLQLQQNNQNHIATSHCSNQVEARGAVLPQILDCKYWTV